MTRLPNLPPRTQRHKQYPIDSPADGGHDGATASAPIPVWVDSPNWPLRLARLARIDRDSTILELIPMMASAGLKIPPTSRPNMYLKSHYQAYLAAALSIATRHSQTHNSAGEFDSTVGPLLPASGRKRSSRAGMVEHSAKRARAG